MDSLDGVVETGLPRDDPTAFLESPWGDAGRAAVLAAVAAACKLGLTVANTLAARGGARERLVDAVTSREPGRGLVTVSNHTSTLDDPALFAALLPLSLFATDPLTGRVRWSLCAREVCFKGRVLADFFRAGKTLPVERGAGPAQPSTAAAGTALAAGGWVHMFPEGRIGYGGGVLPARWGVGALVCDCVARGAPAPLLLPLFHSGMGDVMPRGARVPRVGKRVTVVAGKEVGLADLVPGCAARDPRPAWAAIAARVEAALVELEAEAPPNADQRRPGDAPPRARRRA